MDLTNTLHINIDPRKAESGAKRAGSALNRVKGKADKTTSSVQLLAKAFAYAGGAYAIQSFVKAMLNARQVTEGFQLRLNILLGSVEQGNLLFKRMSEFASEVPFEYQHIMGSATQLAGVMRGGVEEIEKWMPLISDLAAVSGLGIDKTTEQIVRMYSAGAASADLFRERGITAMLGFETGVSYSAEETRKKLIEAYEDPLSKFRGASEKLKDTLQGQLSILSDAWFTLQNKIADTGAYDAAKASVSSLTSVIKDLGGNLDTLWTGVKIFASLLAGPLLLGIKAATFAMSRFTLALIANPIGLIVYALVSATAALVLFSDEITPISGSIANLSDYAVVAFGVMGRAIDYLKGYFVSLYNYVIKSSEAWRYLSIAANATVSFLKGIFNDLVYSVKFIMNGILGLFDGTFKSIIALWNGFPKAFSDIVYQALNSAIELITSGIKSISNVLNHILPKDYEIDIKAIGLEKFRNDAEGSAAHLKNAIADAYKESLNTDYIKLYSNAIIDGVSKLTQAGKSVGLAWKEAAEFRKNERLDTTSKNPSNPIEVGSASKVKQDIVKAKDDFADFISGAKTGIAEIDKEVHDFTSQGKNLVTNFADGFADAFVKMAETGKLSFKDLARSIISDMIRVHAKAVALKLLGSFIGAGTGSGFATAAAGIEAQTGFTGGAKGVLDGSEFAQFANGGNVRSGIPIIVGERGPEIFKPSQTGKIVPNHNINQETKQKQIPNINLTFNIDASGSEAVDVRIQQSAETTIKRVLGEVLERAQGGGAYSQAFGTR